MAVSAEAIDHPGWNPFRVSGTALPPNVLLMAKLIAIALLFTNHVKQLPDPFLPFIPGLDRVMDGHIFQTALQSIFVTAAVALLFNRSVRASSLILGGCMLLGVFASRAYYGNNKTFCALALIFAGLHVRGQQPFTIRWQMAIVYFGAGLNKALDPDWHSGQFFDHWATNRLHQPVYIWLSSLMPALMMGKLMCWMTIVFELSTSLFMLIPAMNLYGVCISALLQSGFLLFTGDTFNMFFFGMQAALFSFLRWPSKQLEIIYDGDCGFCDWCREQITRFDLEKVFHWWPYQSGRGHQYGISDEAASQRFQLVTEGGKVLEGFHALRRILIYTPIFWMVLFLLIAIAPAPYAPLIRRILVGSTLFFFSPLANPIGVAVYGFVARNRHRLFPGRTCAVPQPGSRVS